jgi:(p)ppGpp synthase/HD superfamily hydrolase
MIHRAKALATFAHTGQVRKYTGEPYIVHPARVAALVASVTNDNNVIAAAWLHDVVEDTTITLEELRQYFNDEVCRLVSEVTNVTTLADGNRATRKALERKHLATASPDAQTIKLVDILDNVGSIFINDPGFAKIYLAEKRAVLDILTAGDANLWSLASGLVDNYLEMLACDQ